MNDVAKQIVEKRKKIVEVLKKVVDPEIGINIVDLGFIYDIDVQQKNVNIKMTLTIPGCPLASYITQQAVNELKKLDEFDKINIELVFNPPWSNAMINKKALEKMKIIEESDPLNDL